MGSRKEHDQIVTDTLILLGKKAHHLGRFFPNPTGQAYRDHDWGREHIRYGVLGSPDIYGIITGGRYIGFEVKSGNASQQPNQKRFEAMIKNLGGYYFVVRSPKEALTSVLELTHKSFHATDMDYS